MFDLENPMIAGFAVPMLIMAIVQAAKSIFSLKDQGAQIMAYCVGFVLYGVAYAMAQGMIPAAALPYVQLAMVCIAGPLIPMGFYSLVVKPAHHYMYNKRNRQ